MGLFNIFGNKKNEAAAEEEREAAAKAREEELKEEVRKAHEGLEWPEMPRFNNVVIGDAKEGSEVEIAETVSARRKDEIGELIYEPDIPLDAITSLGGQELLFLLTALEAFNKKAELPGFEANCRKVYNELLGRIRDAKAIYVLYDKDTGFPFVENGYAFIYFEKELSEKMADVYAGQYRKLSAVERMVVDEENPANIGFFEYLYYLGIENMVIDNGAYRARFKRSEIVAAPGEWNRDDRDKTPKNPALNFAMIDFVQEIKWPVNYEKKKDVMKAKEMRMLSLIRNSSFIVPMQHEGPAQVMEDGRIKIDKDTKTTFLVMKAPDGKEFIPVCTDGFEFARINRERKWNAGIFSFRDLIRVVNEKDGIRINPAGQSVLMGKQQMMAIESAGAQADSMKGRKGTAPKTGNSADDAVQKALNQAMARMKDENK